MSISAAIGVLSADGAVRAVRCHNNGTPSLLGNLLLECYGTMQEAEKLLELGELSDVGRRPAPAAGGSHCFDTPDEEVTVAYHRDRNEEMHPAVAFHSVEEYLARGMDRMDAEYLYLLADGAWLVETNGRFVDLADMTR